MSTLNQYDEVVKYYISESKRGRLRRALVPSDADLAIKRREIANAVGSEQRRLCRQLSNMESIVKASENDPRGVIQDTYRMREFSHGERVDAEEKAKTNVEQRDRILLEKCLISASKNLPGKKHRALRRILTNRMWNRNSLAAELQSFYESFAKELATETLVAPQYLTSDAARLIAHVKGVYPIGENEFKALPEREAQAFLLSVSSYNMAQEGK